ncbi:MAG: HAD family hydrolase [Lachnospiraceae bacterium]|nr:HAD family hydrolase [Lachnospiraceae bacterium]
MQTYKYAIFDMDGTLLNSLLDLRSAVNFVCEKYGHKIFSVEEIRKMVGNGNRKLMSRALPDGENDPLFEEKFDLFKKYYMEHCKDQTAPYDGIEDLLQKIRSSGVKSAIVSNKYDAAVREMKESYFGDLIDDAFGVKPGMNVKPAPDAVYQAMDSIGAKSSETVYIGDSDVDAETAKNAGLDCILVTWGFRSRELLEQKQHIALVDNTSELEKFF